jgi:hypothetical protein
MSTDHAPTGYHEPIDLASQRARRAGYWAEQRAETPDERRERIANRLDPVRPRTPFERALSALAWFGTPAFSTTAVAIAFACGYGTCHFFHP